ncbi:MAG: hypothetical protein H7263_03635, partial [Candidatus Sericytochromatia bacterium]|nr:hypothetical protein [Candidatus Sericytochromatia bacterium]
MIEKRLGFESAITKTELGQLNKPIEPIKPTTTQNNNLPIVDQNLTGTVKSSNFKNTEYNFLGQNNNDISAKNLLDKVSDPEIKAKLEVLLTKLNDKNSVVLLDEIINNQQPKLDKGATLDVLNKLNKMADTKYNVSDTKILINSSLKDIAYPNQISQDNKDNCASIALQIQLANRSPFKYLNLLDKFAQGENVTLQNDKPFRLKPDLIKNLKPENISGNIMQTAFNQIDKSNDNTPLEAIFGDKLKYYQPGTLEDTDSLDKKMVNYLESAKPSKENPIQVTMQYDQQHRDLFYMINITGIDKVKNTVNIINQKGQEESITIDKLKDNILGIFITDKLFESSTKSSNPLKAELSNIASNKFVDDIQNSSITVESLKKSTFEKITDPNTQKSVSEFIEKFPDKKSISLYIHELAINRKPEISQDN